MKAQVAVVAIGTKTFPGYQLATGEYGLSLNGLADIVNRDHNTVGRFLKSKIAKPFIDNGSTVGHHVEAILNNGKVVFITFVSIELSYQYLLGQVMNGNAEAHLVVSALGSVSLHERVKSAFGESPKPEFERLKAEQQFMSWKEQRKLMKSDQTIYQDGCIARGLPAANCHDLITKLITGWTAQEARDQGYLMELDEDPTVGLNYQPDANLLTWVNNAKLRLTTYRKGTWQERCERAVKDARPTVER